MKSVTFALVFFLSATVARAQLRGMPRLPTSGGMGLQGSVGTGFADFSVGSPKSDLRVDRGLYMAASIERGFGAMNLYLTLSLSNMSAEGTSNYKYTTLSNSTTYTASDIKFRSNITDLGLGLKLKLIDDTWFRPYVEGGLLGGYHQISYSSASSALGSQGSDYKSADVVMGSGHYVEGGLEAMFSDKFGVKLAGRLSNYKTKDMETFDGRSLSFATETYYFSLLFGF